MGSVTACTHRLSYSYSKCCQVLAVSLLCKILIRFILLKEACGGGCANLAVLGFGRHSHHPGSLTDLKCNILLSEKLCACSFSVALPAASIFAKQCQNTANPAQSHLLFMQCNSYMYQCALAKGSIHLLLLLLCTYNVPPLWGVKNNVIIS